MLKPESKFKVKVMNDLKKLGVSIWYCKINQVSIRGTPDILICLQGLFVALELKKDAASKLTRLQEYSLGEIKKAGGLAFVAYPENWSEIKTKLVAYAVWLNSLSLSSARLSSQPANRE